MPLETADQNETWEGGGGMKSGRVKRLFLFIWMFAAAGICFAGCGDGARAEREDTAGERAGSEGTAGEEEDRLGMETAADGHIDLEALQKQNPDIFAWLYVPGTDIDGPVLQSGIADDYYESHTADGKEGETGALYTEMANLMNMCDFNTIIHGKDEKEGDILYDMHFFENPDFFAEHNKLYLYLSDNVLTYEIVAAYYDEGSDILRRHDYTTFQGCQDYLTKMYGAKDMGKNFREGWEELTPYHFLLTLNGSTRNSTASQYVVIGVLVEDAAGRIERVILD